MSAEPREGRWNASSVTEVLQRAGQCYSVTEARPVLQCYRGQASVTVLQKCYRRQASVTVLQSPGQGTDGGMCDGTYVRELVHVNVTRYELWATSRMPPVLCHNLWGRVYHQ